MSNTLTVAQATTLQNTLDVASTFRVATTKFTVDYSTGDTAVAGALGVNGAGTFSDSLNVTLDATLQKNLLMTDATAALTHSALTGGLQISSSSIHDHYLYVYIHMYIFVYKLWKTFGQILPIWSRWRSQSSPSRRQPRFRSRWSAGRVHLVPSSPVLQVCPVWFGPVLSGRVWLSKCSGF